MTAVEAGAYDMQVQFLEEGERLTARPQGRMEAADGDDFASAVQQRLHAGTISLTIDLEELEFINFGGIRALLRLARSLNGRSTGLDFVRGNVLVRDALDQAGLEVVVLAARRLERKVAIPGMG